MQVENWNIEDVKPYENNPRKNDEAVEKVANSIKEFGWQQPIVVDKDGIVIVGHTRLKAAQMLDLEEVPVHVASDLTDDQAKAYRLADNKTGELAIWDFPKLNIELEDIDWVDMNMEDFGFGINSYFGDDDESEVKEPAGDNGYTYNEQYGVTVICQSEAEQEKVYNKLTKEGYECRVVVV